MADNPQVNTNTAAVGATNVTVAGDDIGGVIHQLVKVEFGAADSATQVSAANPLPVVQTGTPALPTGAATDATVATLLTDAQLRASAVPVSASSLPLPTGAATDATVATLLTDTQLRASAVPVSASSLPLPSGAATETTVATLLTDTQLRATAVPVSGTVALGAGSAAIGKLAANSGVDIGDVDVTSLPALAAGTNVIGKTGYKLVKVTTNFTRPADTTTYAVGDAVTNSTSAPTVFQLDLGALGAVNGQAIEIRKIVVVSSAKQSTMPLFNVFLSDATFTATNDNSALDIADATMEADGAWFNCDVQNSTASNSRVAYLGLSSPMVLAAADTKLYGTIQAANAYVPVSAEKFTILAWVALL